MLRLKSNYPSSSWGVTLNGTDVECSKYFYLFKLIFVMFAWGDSSIGNYSPVTMVKILFFILKILGSFMATHLFLSSFPPNWKNFAVDMPIHLDYTFSIWAGDLTSRKSIVTVLGSGDQSLLPTNVHDNFLIRKLQFPDWLTTHQIVHWKWSWSVIIVKRYSTTYSIRLQLKFQAMNHIFHDTIFCWSFSSSLFSDSWC